MGLPVLTTAPPKAASSVPFDVSTVREDFPILRQKVHGKPLIFGKNRDKGIRLNGMDPEVVELGKGISEDDLLFHDEKAPEPSLAYLLSRMRYEDGYPEPIGVFRAVERPMYDAMINEQIEQATSERGKGDLDKLFRSGDTWDVA